MPSLFLWRHSSEPPGKWRSSWMPTRTLAATMARSLLKLKETWWPWQSTVVLMEFSEICRCLWGFKMYFKFSRYWFFVKRIIYQLHIYQLHLAIGRFIDPILELGVCCHRGAATSDGWEGYGALKVVGSKHQHASLRPTPRVDEQSMHIDPIFLTFSNQGLWSAVKQFAMEIFRSHFGHWSSHGRRPFMGSIL